MPYSGLAAAGVVAAGSIASAQQANLAAGRVRQGTMDFQQWSQGQQQDYATNFASSAHQRQVNDMRAAGLNPILSATGGRGSTGSVGGTAPGASYDQKVPDFHSAVQARLGNSQVRLTEATADKEEAIAKVYKSVGPRVLGGIDAIESTAKSLGEMGARIEEEIRKAIRQLAPSGNVTLGSITNRVIEAIPLPSGATANELRQKIRRELDAIGGPSDWIDSARRRYLPRKRDKW